MFKSECNKTPKGFVILKNHLTYEQHQQQFTRKNPPLD